MMGVSEHCLSDQLFGEIAAAPAAMHGGVLCALHSPDQQQQQTGTSIKMIFFPSSLLEPATSRAAAVSSRRKGFQG